MNVTSFHKVRQGIQENAAPGTQAELGGIEARLRAMLLGSGVFESVEVEQTDDPDRLVVALCRFAADRAEAEVAEWLERTWRDRVSFTYWEVHSLLVDRGHVEFQAATRNGEGGRYVTVHLVAQQPRVPAQRVPVD